MGIAQIPAPSGGLTVTRFPATIGAPFQVPAGLTLQNTVTSTTTFSAGQLPSQVWVVMAGGGGGGSYSNNTGGGGGGTCIGWVDVPSSGITATIGAGGAGGTATAGQGHGLAGGNTYFGSFIAYGGGGGSNNQGGWIPNSVTDATQTNRAPRGPGGGYGNINTSTLTNFGGNNTVFVIYKGCSPFVYNTDAVLTSSTGSINASQLTSTQIINWYGGGAGGGVNGLPSMTNGPGLNGMTGGGGGFNGGAGGNSSRDGGLTNTFTGGTGNNGHNGGGAGLLANGGNAISTAPGAGGSGGGGGGGGNTATGGAGGNGCVLIYY